MSRVFLSHAGSDSGAAKDLKNRLLSEPTLEAAGLAVWLDKDDLIPGTPWKDQIQTALEEASACLVVVGEKGIVNWVDAEVDVALSRAVSDPAFRFVPVLLGAASSSDLMPFARRYHAVRNPLSDASEFDKLVRALSGMTDSDSLVGTRDLTPVVPYPGLRSMDESWSDRFFGRDQETKDLLGQLRQSPIVSIVSASGAGKSSLAMAGLAAAWRGGAYEPSARPSAEDPVYWNVIYVRPEGNALEGLRQAVQATAAQLDRSIEDQVALRGAVNAEDASSTLFAMECGLPAGQVRTLMVLDQAEELVTATRNAGARAKFGQLVRDMVELSGSANRLRVVLTVRDDYANRVHNIPGLDQHARTKDGVLRLHLPKDTGLRAIIEEPLRLARFTDQPAVEAFSETVLKDVAADRDGDMALLQMALHLTWRDKDQHGGLTNTYLHLGGISGALGQEAQRLSREELNEDERALLMPVFMRLVRLGETSGTTRRIAPLEEFNADQRALIDRLAGEDCGRLLQVRDQTVEIAHESLISQWPELAQRVDDHRPTLKTLNSLTTATDRWKGEGKPRRRLASGAEIDDYAPVQSAFPEWLSALEQLFLRQSKRLRNSIRAAAIAVTFLMVGLVALNAYLLTAAQDQRALALTLEAAAAAQRKTAEAAEKAAKENLRMALALLAQDKAETSPDAALKLVLSSWPRDDLPSVSYARAATRALSSGLVHSAPSRLYNAHEGWVWSVAFSPDGTRLLSGGNDRTLRLWDAQSGDELQRIKGHEGQVLSVAFSPDGTRLLSGGEDRTLRLWNAQRGDELQRIDGHEGWVWSVAFSPDGTRLLSGGDDGTLRLWDAQSGAELQRLDGHEGSVRSVAFSPDRMRLLSGGLDRTLRLWDAQSGAELQRFDGHEGWVWSVAFSPDGTRLLSGGNDRTLRLWDAQSGDELQRIKGHEGQVLSVAFSPDGTRLLSGGEDRTLRLWNAQSGDELQRFDGHAGWVRSVAFSPDGTRLLSGSDDTTLRLWDAQSGDELQHFDGHEGSVQSVAFSPDGTRLLSGSDDRTLRLWDAQSGAELQRFDGHEGRVVSVAFSPDGTRLLSGSRDGTLRLWDAQSGKELQRIDGHEGWVQSVAFSPDGTRLLSGSFDSTLRLWDAQSGAELQRIDGHAGPVTSVAFSPDRMRLLSGGLDRTLRLWDAQSGAELQRIKGHEDWVQSVAFSPDGTRLLSGGDDGTLRLWGALDIPGSALQVACAFLPKRGDQHDRDVTGLAAEIGIDELDPIPRCAAYDPPMPLEWQGRDVEKPE